MVEQGSLLNTLDHQTLDGISRGQWADGVRPDRLMHSLVSIIGALRNPLDRCFIEERLPYYFWENLGFRREQNPGATEVQLMERFLEGKISELEAA